MIKKTISYTDFDGNRCTEDAYFNMMKSEWMEMQASVPEGFGKKLQEIAKNKDEKGIIEFVKELIKRSYGHKSPNGKSFIKSEEETLEFMQSEAYSELFVEIVHNADAASEFVNGIIPPDLRAAAEKEMKKAK